MQAWHELGGWQFLGLPLDEASNGINGYGQPIIMQHFERGRLELPVDATNTSQVMLGLVGTEEAIRRGWL